MAHFGEIIRLLPWAAGWNSAGNTLTTDPQFLAIAENVELEFDGTRRKRGGVKKFNQIPIIDLEE
jgi:hypothetical protein